MNFAVQELASLVMRDVNWPVCIVSKKAMSIRMTLAKSFSRTEQAMRRWTSSCAKDFNPPALWVSPKGCWQVLKAQQKGPRPNGILGPLQKKCPNKWKSRDKSGEQKFAKLTKEREKLRRQVGRLIWLPEHHLAQTSNSEEKNWKTKLTAESKVEITKSA